MCFTLTSLTTVRTTTLLGTVVCLIIAASSTGSKLCSVMRWLMDPRGMLDRRGPRARTNVCRADVGEDFGR